MTVKKWHTSAHFIQRCSERGISLDAAKDVVQYGARKMQHYKGANGGWFWHFEKTVDNVTLKVVAEIKGKDCWLITAYEID